MGNNVITTKNSGNTSEDTTLTKCKGTRLNHNDLTVNSQDSIGIGVLGKIDSTVIYKDLPDGFKGHVRHSNLKLYNEKKIIYFTLEEAANLKIFEIKLRDVMVSHSIVFFKVAYKPNWVRMLGKQQVFPTYNTEKIKELHEALRIQLRIQADEYGIALDRVNHIIVTIIPVRVNLLTRYRVDTSRSKEVRSFINDNFITKTVLPITVNPVFLGPELVKEVSNGKITDVILVNITETPDWDITSLKESFLLDPKLSNLSSNFKFYSVVLNKAPYILGLHYLSNNSVRKIRLSMTGLLLEDIVDTVLENGNVKRVDGNSVIILKNDRVINYYKKIQFSPVKSSNQKKLSTENPNIGVLDFETFESTNGLYKIYAGGFKTYLDNKSTTYYLENPEYSEVCVLKLINELLRSKYSKTTFYCHNLGGFDVIFLIKVLVDYNETHENKYELSFKFRDNRILAITISKNGHKLTIKDSYAILNSSLRNLAKSYDTPRGAKFNKSYFPYKFSTENNLFYVGNTPTKSYYEGISQVDYDNLRSDNWSFKEETIKYLELDLETLYEVLSKANKQLFLDYDIDMTKSYTISGLALKLFLNKYYKGNIPTINKKSIYAELKEGYYGGITEVYRPHGRNLFYYDINSLYPYASLNDMPGLTCKNLITTNIKNIPFGFFYCTIDATDVKQEYLGLLPFRSKGLIFPLGKWSGWYFSEEVKFARDNGYKISIIKGYEFNREVKMFDNYVENIYNYKVNASNPVQKSIAKSLLNNLLGRFGIHLEKYNTDIVDENTFNIISAIRDVKGYTNIGKMNLASYSSYINYENVNKLNLDINEILKNHKDSETTAQSASSVVISAAVTAYARIIMNQYKLDILNRGGKIYYSDTDSIVTDIELPFDLVSDNELGKFKLEYKVREGIFISGKTLKNLT